MSLETRTYAGTAQDLADAIRNAIAEDLPRAARAYGRSSRETDAYLFCGELVMNAIDAFEAKL